MGNIRALPIDRKRESFDHLRWKWAEAVAANDTLSPLAKLLAYVLITQFAHRETADCHPGWDLLASAVATSPRSVRRAIVDLEAAGFLARGPGGYSGAKVALLFRIAGAPLVAGVHEMAAKTDRQKVVKIDHQSEKERWPDLSRKVAISDHPPTPPYKDKPNFNQSDRPKKPHSNLEAVIVAGDFESEAWDSWLSGHGYPALEHLGDAIRRGGKAAFVVPYKTPPPDEFGTRISEKWAAWALSERTENER